MCESIMTATQKVNFRFPLSLVFTIEIGRVYDSRVHPGEVTAFDETMSKMHSGLS